MAAIGMALLWASYTLILYGVCLLRGYQITLLDLVVPGRWKGGWPPPLTASGSSGSGSNGQEGKPDQNGNIPVNPPSQPLNPQPPATGEPWWQQLLNSVPLSSKGGGGVQQV